MSMLRRNERGNASGTVLDPEKKRHSKHSLLLHQHGTAQKALKSAQDDDSDT